MQTLGIIGGIAPESTIAYYRAIIRLHRERYGDGSYPPIIINSIDLTRMLGYVERGELGSLVSYMVAEIEKLERAGARLGLLASNTPHIAFDEIRRRSPIPLISIVETAAQEAQRLGFKRVSLFGTRYTMKGRFYPDVFAKANIEIGPASPDEQAYIHDKYLGEMAKAIFRPETRDQIIHIIDTLKSRERIDGVILGGTELPLLLQAETACGLPLLDTGELHARKAVELMASQGS